MARSLLRKYRVLKTSVIFALAPLLATLVSGCSTLTGSGLLAHKSKLATFAAKKETIIESHSEELGTSPIRVSTVEMTDFKTGQTARGIEIAVRAGGYAVYVDEEELPALLRGVDNICGTDFPSQSRDVAQKMFRTRDGIGVSSSTAKTVTPCWIEIGGETVHVSADELKRFGRMLHEAHGKFVGPG